MQKTKIEEMDLLAETDRLVMEQQGKTMDRTSQSIVVTGQEDDKEGRKKAKMWKKHTIKIDSLSKTEQLFMEQQGKKIDRTSQYHHYYHCNRPRRQIR